MLFLGEPGGNLQVSVSDAKGSFHFDVAMKLRTSDVRSMGICSNANTSVQRSGRSDPHGIVSGMA